MNMIYSKVHCQKSSPFVDSSLLIFICASDGKMHFVIWKINVTKASVSVDISDAVFKALIQIIEQ